MNKQETTDTKTEILKAAESLFVEKGYAGTSMRAIATRANVNLAATNYHFGSKLGLFVAAVHHCIKPINDSRLSALDKLEETPDAITLEKILEAFLSPFIANHHSPNFTRILSVVYGEPESFSRPILREEFKIVMERYLKAMAVQLPKVSLDDLMWRFHFMIGAKIHLLKFDSPPGMEASLSNQQNRFDKLISFLAAGLRQDSSNGEQA